MSNAAGTDAIRLYHKALLGKYGSGTAGALGWMQEEGQQARFGMLSRIGNMNGCSVMDAGCGHADLFVYLRNQYPSIVYHGCEQMPELLNIAAHRYKGEKNITLYLGNFLRNALPVTDYVLASGSLNYRHEEDGFIYKAISTLYAQCRLGLGFNLLRGGVDADTLLVAYDAQEIIRFCSTLSNKVELQEGYWQDDFTVFMYK